MIEAGAKEVDDETMFNAIMKAHEEIKDLLGFIDGIVDEIGKPKFEYPSGELDHDMFDKVFAFCEKDLMFALDTDDKNVRDARVVPITDAIIEKFSEEYPDIAFALLNGAESTPAKAANSNVTSLLPDAAKSIGIEFGPLCKLIVELALEQ